MRTLEFLLRGLARAWRMSLAIFLLGTAGAVGAAMLFSKKIWECTGTMIYTPIPVGEVHRGLYASPDLATLTPMVKSPEVLEELAAEFDLDVPTALLEKLFKVSTPKTTQSLAVSLQWADSATAARMTNRLMERFAEYVRSLRGARMESYLAGISARVMEGDQRRAKSLADLQALMRKHDCVDLVSDVDAEQKKIESHQKSRADAIRDEAGLLAQRERMAAELDDFRKKEETEASKQKEYESEMESVSDARRRQDRLRELIGDEKLRRLWMAELATKRSELDRVSSLHDKGAASAGEVEAVNAQVLQLTARLTDSDQVKKWKDELEKIDSAIVPKAKSGLAGSPIITQALFRKLEIELGLVGIHKQIADADRGILESKRRQTALQQIARETESLRKEVDGLVIDRQQLSEQVAFFTRLRDFPAAEFTIVNPARALPNPVSSNRKMILMAGVALAALLALAWAAYTEWQATYHGGRSVARRAGVPSLGEITSEDATAQRLLISRLRDWQPNYGTAILVAGDGTSCDPLPWALRIARRLSVREERVLLLDGRIGELADPHSVDRSRGLGEYLQFTYEPWQNALVPDELPGVDLLPAGRAASMDLLATQRMRQLLGEARAAYSMILIIGPSVANLDGTDLLARQADGIAAVLSVTAPANLKPRLAALLAERPESVQALLVHDEPGPGRNR